MKRYNMQDRRYFAYSYRKIYIIVLIIMAVVMVILGVRGSMRRNDIANIAENANSIYYNNMTQEEMGEYSFISGNLEYVYDGFAKGRAMDDSYKSGKRYVREGSYYNHYYLVECPYSSDNTFMILVAGEHSEIASTIDKMFEQSSDGHSIEGTYSIPFSGYLEKNDSDVVEFAYNVLKEQGVSNFTIAPYTINCNLEVGFTYEWSLSSVCDTVFIVALMVLFFMILIFGIHDGMPKNQSKGLGRVVSHSVINRNVEDYYGEIYHSGTSNSEYTDRQ